MLPLFGFNEKAFSDYRPEYRGTFDEIYSVKVQEYEVAAFVILMAAGSRLEFPVFFLITHLAEEL